MQRFRTLKLIRYVTPMDYFVLGIEIVFLIYLLYYCIEKGIEIFKHGVSFFMVTHYYSIFKHDKLHFIKKTIHHFIFDPPIHVRHTET